MYILDLTNNTAITELYQIENQFENLGNKLVNISNTFRLNNIGVQYILLCFMILSCIPCFLQCSLQYILCKTIKTVPCLTYKLLTCNICKKQKSQQKNIKIFEINNDDKKQQLISA